MSTFSRYLPIFVVVPVFSYLDNLGIGGFVLTAYCLLLTVFWWRRRELNPDPKANAEGLYMLSCFSFRQTLRPDKFCPIPTK